jgi:hypothetical protein
MILHGVKVNGIVIYLPLNKNFASFSCKTCISIKEKSSKKFTNTSTEQFSAKVNASHAYFGDAAFKFLPGYWLS